MICHNEARIAYTNGHERGGCVVKLLAPTGVLGVGFPIARSGRRWRGHRRHRLRRRLHRLGAVPLGLGTRGLGATKRGVTWRSCSSARGRRTSRCCRLRWFQRERRSRWTGHGNPARHRRAHGSISRLAVIRTEVDPTGSRPRSRWPGDPSTATRRSRPRPFASHPHGRHDGPRTLPTCARPGRRRGARGPLQRCRDLRERPA